MSATLSQEEMEGLNPKAEPAKQAAPEFEPRDFRRPLVCSRKELEGLKTIFAGVGQEIAKSLGETLKIAVQAELTSLDQARYETVHEGLPDPCCAYRIQMSSLPAPALLTIDVGIALAATDRLLGGSGKTKFEPRPLQAAERPIVDRIAARSSEAVARGLASLLKFQATPGPLVGSKAEIQLVEMSDAVLAATFGLAGDIPPGEIRLIIPFANLRSLFGKGKGPAVGKAAASASGAVPPAIVAAIQPFPVEASASLGPGQILVGDLMMLEPGDVIALEARIGDRAVVSVAGKPTYEGRLGFQEGRFAVEIEAVVPGGRIGGKK